MLNRFKPKDTSDLDEKIADVLSAMQYEGPTSEEYPGLMTTLERLYALRDGKPPKRIDRDNVVTTTGNILGILVIVSYEHMHVVTSKAMQMLRRPSS